MSSILSLPDLAGNSDDRPLPLIVAAKWNFPLAYAETENGLFFAIQDWVRGLTGDSDIRKLLSNMLKQMSISNRPLPYLATDGKTYQRDFTDDKGLYLIAQHLRSTKSRPALEKIKQFLAESGAFVDLVRREPETVVTSGAIDPDTAIEAAIRAYRAQGKSDSWIQARVQGIVTRKQFIEALNLAVAEVLNGRHYAQATDEIYKGLWGRTAAYLRGELGLPSKANLRDHQPELALIYQRIAEAVAAQKLGERTLLTFDEGKGIVRIVAVRIGKQAQDTSQLLSTDLATGKPLLPNRR